MTQLPAGRYLSCIHNVHATMSGQARAMLMRSRMFTVAGSRPTTIMSFKAAPDYETRHRELLDQGLVLPGMPMLNIYDYYRDRGWGAGVGRGRRQGARRLADLAHRRRRSQRRPDGSPWRNTYVLEGEHRILDYLREDGTPYLRIPDYSFEYRSSWPRRIQCVAPDGRVVGEFNGLGQWFRRWIRDVTSTDDRVFVFMDSRHLVPHLVPTHDESTYLIYVLHNMHLAPPYQWYSPVVGSYRPVLGRISGLDAFVTLTERQRDDIANRRGRTDNLYVVPNPVETPSPPSDNERQHNLVTVVARHKAQKRLSDAISVFRRVVDDHPDARLDIFGSGTLEPLLRRKIERDGLTDVVRLRGFHPQARDAFWRSGATMMTSRYEAYPLTSLESLSRGCPVVSYDIKYGPREQITDGVDGFLVADGDIDAMSTRIVQLLRRPELAEGMGQAAQRTAAAHGPDAFVDSWVAVLEAAIEKKPERTTIRGATLEVTHPRVASHSPSPQPETGHRRDGRSPTGDVLEVRGRLQVEAGPGTTDLSTADVELLAVSRPSGTIRALPLTVDLHGNVFGFSSRVPLDVVNEVDEEERTCLTIRLTWRNSCWTQGLHLG